MEVETEECTSIKKAVKQQLPNMWRRKKKEKKTCSGIPDKTVFKHKRSGIWGDNHISVRFYRPVFAPWLAPCEYDKPDSSAMLRPSSAEHLFGTDEFSRGHIQQNSIWLADIP